MKSKEKSVFAKLFVGCELTSEMLMHLNQSDLWKQYKIGDNDDRLSETRFQDKNYIGRLYERTHFTLHDVKEAENVLKQDFRKLCPNYDVDKIKVQIFPKVFVG